MVKIKNNKSMLLSIYSSTKRRIFELLSENANKKNGKDETFFFVYYFLAFFELSSQ